MERSVKELLGGGLKPNDPRRFLIEAMVGAMSADGVVDQRELAMMQKIVAEHELFQGLAPTAARTLVGRLRAAGATGPGTLPACVGIGISTPGQVAEVLGYADGAIVGSALVTSLAEKGVAGVAATAASLAQGKVQ